MDPVQNGKFLVSGVHAFNGGYFISRGIGGHPVRVIDSYEIIYVTRGRLKMFEDGVDYEVGSGECLLLYPGRKHGGNGTYPPDLAFFWVHFVPKSQAVEKFIQSLPQHRPISCPERMTTWLRRYLDDQESGGNMQLQSELLILLMLTEFQASVPPVAGRGGMAGKALEYIKLNYEQPISTALVAEKLKCNPDYLGRIFKEAFGHTITEQITEERLRHARRLLMESTQNISEITCACGFNDPAYFRRCFVSESGMTPLKFRRLYGKVHLNTE